MKSKICGFFLLLLIFSCAKEEIIEVESKVVTEEITSKRLSSSGSILTFQDHKKMLDRNSFIVGELMKWSPASKNLIINSLDHLSKTTSMSSLLDYTNNPLFFEAYVYVATHAKVTPTICTNPEIEPWPPLGGPRDFDNNGYVGPAVQDLISNLIANKTELYIPNNLNASGNIHTVGHPLVDVGYNTGILIYHIPFSYSIRGQDCISFHEYRHVGGTERANNSRIILSRPNLETANPYSYINFNIKTYLSGGTNSNSGSTSLYN